jgi:hypothetical protein
MLTRQRADCSMTCTAVEDRMIAGVWIDMEVLLYSRSSNWFRSRACRQPVREMGKLCC